jgi:hypothetical protein
MKAPPDRIFAVISAPERLPEWNVSVESARRVTPEEAIGPGSRAIFTGRLLGQPVESETEVVEFEAPRAWRIRAVRGPRLTTRFSVEPEGDLTRVQVDVTGDVPGGMLGERLAEGFLRRELTASLQRLQAIGEADGQQSIV